MSCSVMNFLNASGRAELDKGGAGSNRLLFSEISDAYNDSANDGEYGSFAFIEDQHVADFVTTYDLTKFQTIDWNKARDWFKEMVKLYDAAMVWFTESGTHQPDFMGYVKGKHFLYYYRMYMVEKPNAHKAFNTICKLEDFLPK